MTKTLLTRPLRPLRPLSSIPTSTPLSTIRQTRQFHLTSSLSEQTSRRTTHALRIPPAPSFTNKASSQDHIIFNPPSSAPNAYHTPPKFLPKQDPRRALHAAFSSTTTTTTTTPSPSPLSPVATTRTPLSTASAAAADLPPPVRAPYQKKYHVTQQQVDEMRALRAEDPRKWTRKALVEKFGCSQKFVGMVAKSPEMAEEGRKRLEEVKRRWGRRKREAREDRVRRRESWGRDV